MEAGRRNLVFGGFCLLFVLALFLRASPAVIAHDLMESFSIPASTLGLMAAVYFWIYGLVQIPVGILADRIGVRHTVFVFGLIGVVGSFLFASALNIHIAFLARILIGLGTAGIWVPALKYLSLAYAPDNFASLSSILSSVGSLGFVLSTYPLAFLVERTNWRMPFFLVAAMLLLFVIFAWFTMDLKFTTAKRDEKKDAGDSQKRPAIYLLLNLKFLYFIVWGFFVYGVLFSIQTLWGAAYLQDVFSISREMAGMNLMFTSIGIIAGGPFWGLLSDRFLKARKPVLVWATMGFLATLLLFLFKTHYWGSLSVSLLYFCFGFLGTVFLIDVTCVKEFFPLTMTGTVIGVLNTVMILSVGFFQSITGYFIDYFGAESTIAVAYQKVFLLYSICAVLAFFLALFIPETFGRIQTGHEGNGPGGEKASLRNS
ncbi:MAG: MFS transporter [Firmicutes bacterium]|nr:MFS transporter [Bacillota bacterium]